MIPTITQYHSLSYILHNHYFAGSVDESDSILIIIRDAPRTTRNSAYVPVFVTPIVDTELEAVIEETCGDNSECAYDIAVTGNVDVGRETLDDIEEHMAIINLSLPSMYAYSLIILLT